MVTRSSSRRGARRKPKIVQHLLEERGRGGPRKGAGRPKKPDSGMPHLKREPLNPRYPVHVTVKFMAGLPSMRAPEPFAVLLRSFDGVRKGGSVGKDFRILQFSVQSNHLHLIVEAKDRDCLSRGMRGLTARIVQGLNKLWNRTGSMVPDRYHDEILRTPKQVRNALAYVLNNAARHGITHGAGPDPYSSGRSFDGWSNYRAPKQPPDPVVRAETWLINAGWRRFYSLVHTSERPGPKPRRRSPARPRAG